MIGVSAFLFKNSRQPEGDDAAGRLSSAFDSLLDPYRGVVPDALIREYPSELMMYTDTQLTKESAELHELYHEYEGYLRESDPWRRDGVLVELYRQKEEASVDLSGSDVESLMASMWPAYLARVFEGDEYRVFVVPLPYIDNEAFWNIKMRLCVVDALIAAAPDMPK